jgi:hypothetical protein
MLMLMLASITGCPATTAAGVASAVADTLTVLKTARALICTTKLDPLLGNPRDGQPTWVVATPHDASGIPTDAEAD